MKKNSNSLHGMIVLVTLFASCSYSNYIPITVNEPMLKEAGEKQGTLYLGSNHVELQGAYAVTKHFGVVGDIWKGFDKRYSVELMPGYYYSAPNGFCAGFYAGAGIANTTGQHEIYSPRWLTSDLQERWTNHTRYTSLMCQPGVGYRLKNFEIGFASRVSYVMYSRYETEYSYWFPNENTPVVTDTYKNNDLTMLLFQPAFNISAGLEHVKAFCSVSMNIPVRDIRYAYRPLHPTFEYYLVSSGLKIDLMRGRKFGSRQRLVF